MSLAGLIAVLATALILGQARLIASGTLRAEALDAMRTAALLMPMEARSLAASDIHAISSDSAAFRAFRGSGIACQVQGARATLRYRGWRDMDATMDSVVILTRVPERSVAISSVGPASGTCTALGGEILLDVALAGDTLLAGDAVLVFEAGAYHLTTGALRYRAPGGSRQPLTADVVAGTGFGIVRRAPPGLSEPLAIELGLAPIPRNALTQPTLSAGTVKVSLLNVSAPPDSTE
jgi:hypothetical protein